VAGRRASRRPRGAPKRHDQMWTVLVIENQAFGPAPAVQLDLCDGADWAAGTGFERATLLRIRGWLVLNSSIDTAGSAAFMTISKVDENDPAAQGSPTDPVTYVDEDVLWTGGAGTTVLSAVAPDMRAERFDVDVKAMRRMTLADDIRISFETTGADLWLVNGVLRCLVRRG